MTRARIAELENRASLVLRELDQHYLADAILRERVKKLRAALASPDAKADTCGARIKGDTMVLDCTCRQGAPAQPDAERPSDGEVGAVVIFLDAESRERNSIGADIVRRLLAYTKRLEADAAFVSTALEETEKVLAGARGDLKKSEEKRKNLYANFNSLTETNAKLRERAEAAERQEVELRVRIAELAAQLVTEREEHQRNRDRRDHYKAKAFTAWDRAAAHQKERDQLRAELAQLRGQVSGERRTWFEPQWKRGRSEWNALDRCETEALAQRHLEPDRCAEESDLFERIVEVIEYRRVLESGDEE